MVPTKTSSPRLLSDHPAIPAIAGFFGTMALGFGINAILHPMSEITLFGLQDFTTGADPVLIDALMVVFGAKLIGAACATYATALFGSKKSLGLVLIAGGCVAGVDGLVCKTYVGTGEWNHWGYGGMMVLLGSVVLGVVDRR